LIGTTKIIVFVNRRTKVIAITVLVAIRASLAAATWMRLGIGGMRQEKKTPIVQCNMYMHSRRKLTNKNEWSNRLNDSRVYLPTRIIGIDGTT
jgi:hypothetical protein